MIGRMPNRWLVGLLTVLYTAANIVHPSRMDREL